MSEKPSFLYIVCTIRGGQAGAPVKVGISDSPGSRIAQLRTSSPHQLEFLHVFSMPSKEIAREFEYAFHQVKKTHRLNGEWFDLSPADAMQAMFCNFAGFHNAHLKGEFTLCEFLASLESPISWKPRAEACQ